MCVGSGKLGSLGNIKLLKQINHELSMNLFFEKDEATKLLKELSSYS